MSSEEEKKQTSKWQLEGATYFTNNTFHFVGDFIQDKTQLIFNVNGASRLIVIPDSLKSLDAYSDKIKNGVVHYNIKSFEVNHYTLLSIDSSWIQSDTTIICYCQMPYEALPNTPILCDKHNVISGSITKTNECGVKVINRVLAIRLPKAQLGIDSTDSYETSLIKFNSYLQSNPFSLLYILTQPVSLLLEDYVFDIQASNNQITCETQYPPLSFSVEYPVDVLINMTVDVKEIQELAAQVKEAKSIIDKIKIDLDDKTITIKEQYNKVLEVEKQVNNQMLIIEDVLEKTSDAQEQVQEATDKVKKVKQEIDAVIIEVRTLASEIKDAIAEHTIAPDAHLDIRELIKDITETTNFNFGSY